MIVKLISIQENKLEILNSLVGIVEDYGYTLEDVRSDRLARQFYEKSSGKIGNAAKRTMRR